MAANGSHNLGFRLDIKQILSEAQHRWLRPAEICEILRNYQKFHITPEPPHKPGSGSVFLFDRKVLRYFRKDGHNWRKKKDGKTVKEAHEKLKVGSVDMLHCYYAHGEDNENFQRRSYWMLEQDLMHIVFVHYLEVKGNKASIHSIRDTETISSNSQNDSSFSTSSAGNYDTLASPYADTTSPTSTLASTCEDAAESVGVNPGSNSQTRPRYTYPGRRPHGIETYGPGIPGSYDLYQRLGTQINPALENLPFSDGPINNFVSGDQTSWEDVLGHSRPGMIPDEHKSWNSSENQINWQGDYSLRLQGTSDNQNLMPGSTSFSQGSFLAQPSLTEILQNAADPYYVRPGAHEVEHVEEYMMDKSESVMPTVGTGSHLLKQPHLNGIQAEESLKKVDSFSRWMAKELGEADVLNLPSSNGYSWSALHAEDMVGDSGTPAQLQLDSDTLNFSLSQDQLFSITEFSPSWAYSSLETKVLVTGKFLKSGQELTNCKWSCMFGEVEVPAEVVAEGVLFCISPPHKSGVVPCYITCSNRLACSEVREFEFRAGPLQDIDFTNIPGGNGLDVHLQKRLENLLLSGSAGGSNNIPESVEKREVVSKIISLMEAECYQKSTEEQQGENWLKEKLFLWLLQKVTEGGKGPLVVDGEGQGVLHLAASLGLNWALKPIIISGVSIDFRDVNGWTALHWAALCGREDTVVALVSLGAAPGALTDPSLEHLLGRTPADLASANGHKGISGFLAESSLIKHLSTLNVKDSKDGIVEYSVSKPIQTTISERIASPITEEDVPDSLSLKDSLAAVCNATQTAARIHQILRVQSFERKQFDQSSDQLSADEHALSLLAPRTSRLGRNDWNAHAAAVSIQKKYRGWKKRKEFLLIRQRIVKIQAHVRGHQVRKKYKSIVWSVGILEKVILRWRRKARGLRGFRSDTVVNGPAAAAQATPKKEDDYDFLDVGRKQTEERMQKALSRVKSMAQYPEARAQYRRLLTVAEGFRETEAETSSVVLRGSQDMVYTDEELFDVESLLDDDTFMSLAFE